MEDLPPADDGIELSISSSLQHISAITLCARTLSEYFGLDDQQVMQTELAVSEAITNVIEHAYENKPDQTVVMKIRKLNGQLEIRILDQGIALEADRLNNASDMYSNDEIDPLALLAESGRGLGLMQSLMDSVEVSREDNWNILTMCKTL